MRWSQRVLLSKPLHSQSHHLVSHFVVAHGSFGFWGVSFRSKPARSSLGRGFIQYLMCSRSKCRSSQRCHGSGCVPTTQQHSIVGPFRVAKGRLWRHLGASLLPRPGRDDRFSKLSVGHTRSFFCWGDRKRPWESLVGTQHRTYRHSKQLSLSLSYTVCVCVPCVWSSFKPSGQKRSGTQLHPAVQLVRLQV